MWVALIMITYQSNTHDVWYSLQSWHSSHRYMLSPFNLFEIHSSTQFPNCRITIYLFPDRNTSSKSFMFLVNPSKIIIILSSKPCITVCMDLCIFAQIFKIRGRSSRWHSVGSSTGSGWMFMLSCTSFLKSQSSKSILIASHLMAYTET